MVVESPGDVQALYILVSIYANSNRLDQAIEACRAILRVDPRAIEANINLAALLRAKGAIAECMRVAQQVIQLAPREASGYLNLGLGALGVKAFDQAIANLETADRLKPGVASTCRALGSALYGAGRLEAAKSAFESAAALSPNDAGALTDLARVQLDLGQDDDAAATIVRLRGSRTPDAPSEILLSRLLGDLGLSEEAEELLAKTVDEHPENIEARQLLVVRLQETGRFEDSRVLLRGSLEVAPNQGFCYWGLVQGCRLDALDQNLIDEMESALEARGLAAIDRKYLHYALGKSYDDLKQFESAMAHYHSANRIADETDRNPAKFSLERYHQAFSQTIAMFSREFMDRWTAQGNPSRKPIFIVGMMRSGTTLVDQILSSHSAIGGAGELEFWFERWPRAFDFTSKTVDKEKEQEVTAAYLALLRRLSPGSIHVTDKKPQNFLHLGAIHTLLPNAKIVHCRRNPADTCLSIYMNPFLSSSDYVHKPENLVAFYREYERLMGNWREVIPESSMIEVTYEELISNPEAEARRLIEFCGLSWEDACLQHQDNSRTIRTLSVWQARQPIYRSSVARWKNYEPWLGAFRELT